MSFFPCQCFVLSPDIDFRFSEGKEIGDTPAKDSLAYIQLEKQNERLKEALIKLVSLPIFPHPDLIDFSDVGCGT